MKKLLLGRREYDEESNVFYYKCCLNNCGNRIIAPIGDVRREITCPKCGQVYCRYVIDSGE